MCVLSVLLVGFSFSFAASMPSNQSFDRGGVVTTLLAMLGAFEPEEYVDGEPRVFFSVFLFLVVVVMLNLMIAVMTDAYATVVVSADRVERTLRARTIVDEEALMSKSERHNPQYFPDYILVLRPVEERVMHTAPDKLSMVCEDVREMKEQLSAHAAHMQELTALMRLLPVTKPAVAADLAQ